MRLPLVAIFVLIFVECHVLGQKKNYRRSKSEQNRVAESNAYSAPLQESPSYSSNQQYSAGQSLRNANAASGPPPPQVPPVLSSLDILRGRPPLQAKEAGDIISYATAGKDYPVYNEIPKTYFSCSSYKPGYYADTESYCQVYHRCDISGKLTSYLCPPKTLFNQITLVCDWFYNVNCPNSRQFSEYSNSRLYYPQWQLLDTQLDYQPAYVQAAATSHGQQLGGPHQQQLAAGPPLLYPPKQNMLYNDNVNARGPEHNNPEYQMSLVIRNPQLVPDYTAGESNLVPAKEQMDQGSTLSPPSTSASEKAEAHADNQAPPNEQPRRPHQMPQLVNATAIQEQQNSQRSMQVPNRLAYAS